MKISKSSLTSFITCPRKYELAYELEIRPLKHRSELLIGSSTHYLISRYFIRKRAGEPTDLNDILRDFWSPYDLNNTDFGSHEELESAMVRSLDLARVFFRETELDPREVEYKFSLPVVNVKTGEVLEDVELCGIIDMIDQPNGRSRAIEIKTRSRKADDFGAQTSVELTCYAYWLRFLDDGDRVLVSYANIIKNKRPYIQWQHQERSTEHFVELFHTIRVVVGNIKERRFYRNPGVHCNWCDYRPICAGDTEATRELFGEEALELVKDLIGSV